MTAYQAIPRCWLQHHVLFFSSQARVKVRVTTPKLAQGRRTLALGLVYIAQLGGLVLGQQLPGTLGGQYRSGASLDLGSERACCPFYQTGSQAEPDVSRVQGRCGTEPGNRELALCMCAPLASLAAPSSTGPGAWGWSTRDCDPGCIGSSVEPGPWECWVVTGGCFCLPAAHGECARGRWWPGVCHLSLELAAQQLPPIAPCTPPALPP